VITKFAFATSCGFQPGNPYKVNQDSYTLVPNVAGHAGFHLFAVCDGHGVNGHKVSADIKAELPKQMEDRLRKDSDFLELKDSNEIRDRIPRYFKDSF
jgi:serine/threonine protein phosphatase PrpC